jgi:hypothetical protein
MDVQGRRGSPGVYEAIADDHQGGQIRHVGPDDDALLGRCKHEAADLTLLTAAGVAMLAVGAMALVVAPALWIARRRRTATPPAVHHDYVRGTPCTHTSQ